MITIDKDLLIPRLLGRKNDSHKGDYGHLLVVAGCERMPGAAVLATGAALKSGCGLVTLHSTARALQACANLFPSAMLSKDPARQFSAIPLADIARYAAIAVGPGLGKEPMTARALEDLLESARGRAIPAVLDADALNLLAEAPRWQDLVPAGSVLTPHPGELGRLFPQEDDGSREAAIRAFCAKTGSVLVRKGYRTNVFAPSGECFVNTTGNPGMAKGGSGDVLTGLVGGLMARGYCALDAALLGVWIHGYAGDALTSARTAEAWSSRDLVDFLWQGFAALSED